MSTLFRGLSEIIGPKYGGVPVNTYFISREKVRVGQVIEVVLDDSSDNFGNDLGIGVVLFRFNPADAKKSEASVNNLAFPLDRTHFTVPLPGEQVLIYPILIGSRVAYAYGQIIQQNLNNAYNSEPFVATQPKRVSAQTLDAFVDIASLEKRFEDKFTIPTTIYKGHASYHRSLREGDVIVESRFGSSILFTSTMEKNIVKTLFTDLTIGKDLIQNSYTTGDGDPVVILQATKRPLLDVGKAELVKPSINEDDSSVYLTTTQAIPIKIACSRTMYSWNVDLIKKEASTTLDPVTHLAEFFPDKYDPNDVLTLNLTTTFTAGNSYNGSLDASAFKGGDKESNILMLIDMFKQAGVVNRFAILGALATIGKESGFVPKNEYGYGTTSSSRLRDLFGSRLKQFSDAELDVLKKDNVKFYDYIYGYLSNPSWNTKNTDPGDGWKYRGRGFNQITFKSLYEKYSETAGVDLVTNPDLLNEPNYAGICAVKFCLGGLKTMKIDPNGFSNLDDAVYYCVKANAGGSKEVRGTETLAKAQKVAQELSTLGLV